MRLALYLLLALAPQQFEVIEATIPQLQAALKEGKTTSRALVEAYLARIAAYDAKGPRLNSIIMINPNALKEAEKLDAERARGNLRGSLHGIPIIVKDNYDTTDMPTTAGSVALAGFVPPDDAFQVRKLREAGAIIIAKSNMHELASGITTISSFGGQTRNPYDPERNPGGSSGGTGAAIAASFAAAGMGSDTCGSIRIPSSHNNLVGLRPTKGLSSIDGIIPLSVTQDVGGPLARTVTDLAIVLDATIGEDSGDPATKLKPGQLRPKFVDALDGNALHGARLGVLTAYFGDAPEDQEVARIIRAALDEMKKTGATVVDVAIPELAEAVRSSSVIDLEFKEDLANYLTKRSTSPVKSLGEILQKGLYNVSLDGSFRRRDATKGRDSDDYRTALSKRAATQELILKLLDDSNLDALVYPTMKRKPAKIGEGQAGSNCQLSATLGYPAISVPAGFTDDGLPLGIELLGRPLADARLVALAYSYEREFPHRRAPAITPALNGKPAPTPVTFEGKAGSVAAKFVLDPATNNLSYTITLTNLKWADVLYMTLHRAASGKSGPEIGLLNGRAGAWPLSNTDRHELEAGNLYLNVGTRGLPNGEFRIQLEHERPRMQVRRGAQAR